MAKDPLVKKLEAELGKRRLKKIAKVRATSKGAAPRLVKASKSKSGYGKNLGIWD